MTPASADASGPGPDRLPLPTFLIIGAQKSATRWLRYNLDLHPEVFMAGAELSYFDNDTRFALGDEFYRSQFAGWHGEPLVGESTPGYLMWRHEPAEVSRRIDDRLPGVKLFAVLRDPVERARSALVHHIKYQRIRPRTDLLAYARDRAPETDRHGLIAGGWYAASLEPFVDRFGDRLQVVLHDDIRDRPLDVYEKALAHVGAEGGFVPPDLGEVRFSNRPPEQPSGPPDREPDDAERAELFAYFADDVTRLESMIDRDLSDWRP